MTSLVVAEHRHGVIRPMTFELVTAAQGHDGEVVVVVIAPETAQLAAQLQLAGIDRVITVASIDIEYESDVYLAVCEALVREQRPDLVLAGFTPDGMGFGPGLAARLGAGFVGDVFGLRLDGGALVATRGLFGGRVHADVEFPGHDTVVALVRPGAYAVEDTAAPVGVTEVAVEIPASRGRHLEFIEQPRQAVDVGSADIVLAVGGGIGGRENLPRFEGLATAIGATLATSRPLVEAGAMPSTRLIGQSGLRVAPPIYLAMGISGAVQHLAGIRSSGTIIAVDTDPDAQIFTVADYGVVGDAVELAGELEAHFR